MLNLLNAHLPFTHKFCLLGGIANSVNNQNINIKVFTSIMYYNNYVILSCTTITHNITFTIIFCNIKFGSGVERLDVPATCTDVNLDQLLDKLLTSTTVSIVPTQLRQNPCYYQIYIVWLNIIFNGIVPFLALIILNTSILRHLVWNERLGSGRRVRRGTANGESLRIHHHPSLKRKRGTKVSMAKVSFAIVFVFIICHSIRWIPNIYEFFWVR